MTHLLTRAEVADFLQVPPKTLATWAYEGKGPSFYRVGRHARYRRQDVELFLRENRQPAGERLEAAADGPA